MAKPKSLSQQVGLTQGKLVVVITLAVILVGVLYKQFGRSTPAEPLTPPMSVSSPEPSGRPPARVAGHTKSTRSAAKDLEAATMPLRLEAVNRSAWNTPVLERVIQYDPFALPAAFPQPALAAAATGSSPDSSVEAAEADAARLADAMAELQTELEQLKHRGVHVIVRERDEYVALIGDRTIHVGDEINGFTVTAIRPDGVHVERKVEQ